MTDAQKGLELRSRIGADGRLQLLLARTPALEPAEDEVVVEMRAAPINPSDLALLIGAADLSTAIAEGVGEDCVVTADVPPSLLRAMKPRLDQSLPVGNEGAGVVVRTGASQEAQDLMGRTVSLFGGGMYTQFRRVRAADCLVLPEGASAADGASCFVNPLTALAMVETLRLEGHKGLIHTAAASNLGQMLNRVCLSDGVPLVNIVRSAEQKAILQGQGAMHVVDSNAPDFSAALGAALAETGATLAFDAVGGGTMGGQILAAVESVASAKAQGYSRYGSDQFKQLYIYGALDMGPTVLNRLSFGFAWGVGGFLLMPFLQRVGPSVAARMRQRVMDELKTTFASHYSHTISLFEALNLDTLRAYNRKATGDKYLIDPALPPVGG